MYGYPQSSSQWMGWGNCTITGSQLDSYSSYSYNHDGDGDDDEAGGGHGMGGWGRVDRTTDG